VTSPLLELGRRATARLDGQSAERARLHLFDALGAALAGAGTPEGGIAGRQLAAATPGGRAPAPADLVLALSRRIRCTEMDDLQLESVTTAGAAVVPALIGALAVAGGPAMGEALDALAAGYDVMFTLGLACGGPDYLYGQGGWPSLTAAGPAAAATAGRLLGLSAEATGHAIALALLSTPRPLRGGEDGRWLGFGLAAAAGFQSALAAAAGARADPGLLDAGRPAVSEGGALPRLGAVMELPWSPGRGLAKAHFKRWASAGQVAAVIDAAGVLAERHGFAAADVASVGVHVPPAYRRMIDQPSGSGRLWSLISAQYQVAARLLAPEDLYDCVRARQRDSPGFTRLMGVVQVHDDESLAARHPRSYPARVVVTLADGTARDFLSDGRSPAPDWTADDGLRKARAAAGPAAAESMVGRLGEATIRSADCQELLTLVTSLLSGEDRTASGGCA
jgi:2-methylcitrate dehydratase PrpD